MNVPPLLRTCRTHALRVLFGTIAIAFSSHGLAAQAKAPPPDAARRVSTLDFANAKLADVIRTLMQKKPRDRFQHPGELIDSLRPLTIPDGDTLNDASSITCTGLPHYQPDEASTVRTDEVPVSQLLLVDHESGSEKIVTGRPRDRRGWMLAVLVVALTMVAVILTA